MTKFSIFSDPTRKLSAVLPELRRITTLLLSAKCTRPLFQGRTGCGGRPSGWHDIVTYARVHFLFVFRSLSKHTDRTDLFTDVSNQRKRSHFWGHPVFIRHVCVTLIVTWSGCVILLQALHAFLCRQLMASVTSYRSSFRITTRNTIRYIPQP